MDWEIGRIPNVTIPVGPTLICCVCHLQIFTEKAASQVSVGGIEIVVDALPELSPKGEPKIPETITRGEKQIENTNSGSENLYRPQAR